MKRKTITMIVLGVSGVALFAWKAGPFIMPRSVRLNIAAKKAGLPPPIIAENKKSQTAPPDASATPVSEASTPNPDGGRFNHIMKEFKRTLWRDFNKLPLNEEPKNPFIAHMPHETPGLFERGISIEGIIWDEKKPLIIVGGKLYGSGDQIGEDVMVEAIKPDRCVLTCAEEKGEFFLRRADNSETPVLREEWNYKEKEVWD